METLTEVSHQHHDRLMAIVDRLNAVADCSDAYFGPIRSVVSAQSDQLFRSFRSPRLGGPERLT